MSEPKRIESENQEMLTPIVNLKQDIGRTKGICTKNTEMSWSIKHGQSDTFQVYQGGKNIIKIRHY